MNNFINQLKENEDTLKIKNMYDLGMLKCGRTRILNQISAGDYELSIQASEYHYCEPRKTIEDLSEYTSMEVAIFKDNSWVQPRKDEYIKSFKRYKELIDCYEEGDIAVGGYIPVNLIQDLFDYLSL